MALYKYNGNEDSISYSYFNVFICLLLYYGVWPFKDEAQTALFKRPSSYRAVNTFHLGYKNQSV